MAVPSARWFGNRRCIERALSNPANEIVIKLQWQWRRTTVIQNNWTFGRDVLGEQRGTDRTLRVHDRRKLRLTKESARLAGLLNENQAKDFDDRNKRPWPSSHKGSS